MKVKKPITKTCDCGHLTVKFMGSARIIVSGGWIRVKQQAACNRCKQRIRFAPRIDLATQDGEVYSVGQE